MYQRRKNKRKKRHIKHLSISSTEHDHKHKKPRQDQDAANVTLFFESEFTSFIHESLLRYLPDVLVQLTKDFIRCDKNHGKASSLSSSDCMFRTARTLQLQYRECNDEWAMKLAILQIHQEGTLTQELTNTFVFEDLFVYKTSDEEEQEYWIDPWTRGEKTQKDLDVAQSRLEWEEACWGCPIVNAFHRLFAARKVSQQAVFQDLIDMKIKQSQETARVCDCCAIKHPSSFERSRVAKLRNMQTNPDLQEADLENLINLKFDSEHTCRIQSGDQVRVFISLHQGGIQGPGVSRFCSNWILLIDVLLALGKASITMLEKSTGFAVLQLPRSLHWLLIKYKINVADFEHRPKRAEAWGREWLLSTGK